ncbi:MAG: ABC transporter substrate-binding protein [Chloroflexi bacterium]|nr:ABC transporter substrate-binding protein [Chloroflexota bacterium]MDA1145898.1 ABC transporter substrate-binding protein [Chloroflexota bacterium]
MSDLTDLRTALPRRRFLHLAGIGVAGLAGAALIGCGDDEGDAATSTAASGGDGGELEQTTLRVGYLPITDASPLLAAHGRGIYEAHGLEAERPTLFRSWSSLAEAFQARQVDVVHILMPMAIWLRFGQDVPLNLVAWNHSGGSALTTRFEIDSLDQLAGQTVAVPFWYSIHNTVLQMMLRDAGLTAITEGDADAAAGEVKLIVMAPPDMPPALANNSIQGYIVADPFNAVAEINDVGKVFRFVPDVWLDHACCVVVMHQSDVEEKPNWAQAVVSSIAEAQVYIRENRVEAAQLLSTDGEGYLPQPLPAIERALTHYDLDEYTASGAIQHPDWDTERIDFQPFPFQSYTEELIRQMKLTVVEGDRTFLDSLDPTEAHQQLIADQFARAAIAELGGPSKFDLPESLTREERIDV